MGVKEEENTIIVDDDDHNLNDVPEETAEIPFPELQQGSEYLLSLFHSCGSAVQTGMGLVSLSWQEIEAWVRCNALEDTVSPWELQVIKQLSEAYCAEYSRASDPKRKMPYRPVMKAEEIDHEAVAKQTENIFNMLMARD